MFISLLEKKAFELYASDVMHLITGRSQLAIECDLVVISEKNHIKSHILVLAVLDGDLSWNA